MKLNERETKAECDAILHETGLDREAVSRLANKYCRRDDPDPLPFGEIKETRWFRFGFTWEAHYTHIPTGVGVSGMDTNYTKLRLHLHRELARSVAEFKKKGGGL